MIAEEIAKEYGLKCANYDLASYDGMIGTISENFLLDNDKFYYLSEIIGNNNNIENILKKLYDRYNNMEVISALKNELIDIFIFDILIANHDRHTDNLGIIESSGDIHFCPVFDNDLMLDYRSIYGGDYSLTINQNSNEDDLIKVISENSENIYFDKLSQSLQIITSKNITQILNKVENKICATINPHIKRIVFNSFIDNYKKIDQNLKSGKQLMKK